MLWEQEIQSYREMLLGDNFPKEGQQRAVRRAKQAFLAYEAEKALTYPEFLYGQCRYIKKRWWVLQAGVLLLLWLLLQITSGGQVMQRNMSILSSLFVMLILPELWKNAGSRSMEIESAVLYSLRQVYAARMFLFAIVDFGLLSMFFLGAMATGSLTTVSFFVNFLIPFVMTCCICFRTLCSRRISSEYMAFLLCILWTAVWSFAVVENERIYNAIVLPVWGGLFSLSLLYLAYCIQRTWRHCERIWEENTLWN